MSDNHGRSPPPIPQQSPHASQIRPASSTAPVPVPTKRPPPPPPPRPGSLILSSSSTLSPVLQGRLSLSSQNPPSQNSPHQFVPSLPSQSSVSNPSSPISNDHSTGSHPSNVSFGHVTTHSQTDNDNHEVRSPSQSITENGDENLSGSFSQNSLVGDMFHQQSSPSLQNADRFKQSKQPLVINDGISPTAVLYVGKTPKKPDLKKDEIKLAHIVSVYYDPPFNRFAGDFLPPAQSNDVVVTATIEGLGQPIKTISKNHVKYQKYEPPPAKTNDYEVDIVEKDSESEAEKKKKKKADLQDMFTAPSSETEEIPSSPSSTLTEVDTTATEEKTDPKAVEDIVDVKLMENIEVNCVDQKKNLKALEEEEEDGVFWRYQPEYEYKASAELAICHREPTALWSCDRGTQILVSVKALRFAIENIEPFFCTLALYDLKSNIRLSEEFHFDLNDKEVLTGQMEVSKSCADEITLSRHAIFSVSDRHEGVYLVLKIERVLQGDSADNDVYLKPKNRTDAEVKQISKKIRAITVHLSEYRQTFAWGILPLFRETGEVINEGKMQQMDKIYFQPESMKDETFVALAKEVVLDPLKKLKPMPKAYLELRIDQLTNQFPTNRVDPSSIALKDSEVVMELPDHDKKSHPVVKEVEEFVDRSAIQHIPHTYFINLMYVYPEQVNLSKFRNVTCKIQVKTDENLQDPGLKVILGKSSTSAFTTSHLTQINYHKKNPQFQDEVKLMLPLSLSNKTHLFFTFYQVSIKKKPGKKDVIGYSILPIYLKNRVLDDGVYDLPIAETISDSYFTPFVERRESKDLHFKTTGDNVLKVKIKLVSSIFNQDPGLNEFFRIFPPNDKELLTAGKEPSKLLLEHAVDQLQTATPLTCVKFMPYLINYLLKGIVTRIPAARDALFEALCHVVHRVSLHFNETNRCPLLVAYVNHKFDNVQGVPLYGTLCKLLLTGLQKRSDSKGERTRDARQQFIDRILVEYSWIWLELIFKSMILERQEIGCLDQTQQDEFISNFETCIDLFVQLIHRHRSAGLTATKHLVHNLALFLCDLFTVLPKDTVISFIEQFLSKLEVRNDPVLIEFKFTFYEILFDFEYILDVNEIDVPLKIETDVMASVSTRYRLPTLFVDDYSRNLEIKENVILEKVINSLRHVLTKFEYDERLQKKKPQLATMFLTIVPTMVEEVSHIREMEPKMQRNTLINLIWVLKYAPRDILRQWWLSEDPDTLSEFVSLIELALSNFQYKGHKVRATEHEFRSILSPESISSFMEGPPSSGGSVSDMKSNIENLMQSIHKTGGTGRRSKSSGSNSRKLVSQNSTTNKTSGKSTLRQLRANMSTRTGTFKRSQNQNTLTVSSKEYLLKLLKWEGALHYVVTRTILSVLFDFMDDQKQNLKPQNHKELISRVLSLLCFFLNFNQPTSVLLHFFPLLRLFLQRYGVDIFKTKHLHGQIRTLTGEIFRHCTYVSPKVRTNAVALLFQLLIQNFIAEKNLSYLQVALTVSLSKMVPNLKSNGEVYLKQGLGAVKTFNTQYTSWLSNKDESKKFSTELETLLNRLSTILQDSVEISRQSKLGEFADPTTSENLLVQVADAFSHMPEIRIEWINRLAQHHTKIQNFAEAGQCYLTSAHIQSEIQHAASNTTTAIGERENINAEKSICEHYENATQMLDKAELYEQCVEIYKLLIPIYEKKKNYESLSKAYLHIHEVYEKLIEAEKKQTRMLGTYYRVGFYGKKFGERLDGNEFIYKMPKITRLSEITSWMKKLYSTQLKTDVKILPDSNPVDASKFDPNECVMQVTFVTPHFDEKEERDTFIQQNTKLVSFKFSTPFTKTGKAYGDVVEQHKRNTVLYVKEPFPSVKTAQKIIKRVETILSPIESAIEDVQLRTERMNAEVDSPHGANKKALSGLLAGTVAPQVHGGAKEICAAFLTRYDKDDKQKEVKKEEKDGKERLVFDPNHQAALRKAFDKFLMACQRALDLNKTLCESDQEREFQANLDAQFDEMCQQMQPYLTEPKQKKPPKRTRANQGVRFQ